MVMISPPVENPDFTSVTMAITVVLQRGGEGDCRPGSAYLYCSQGQPAAKGTAA
jgi:hypothetical protein